MAGEELADPADSTASGLEVSTSRELPDTARAEGRISVVVVWASYLVRAVASRRRSRFAMSTARKESASPRCRPRRLPRCWSGSAIMRTVTVGAEYRRCWPGQAIRLIGVSWQFDRCVGDLTLSHAFALLRQKRAHGLFRSPVRRGLRQDRPRCC